MIKQKKIRRDLRLLHFREEVTITALFIIVTLITCKTIANVDALYLIQLDLQIILYTPSKIFWTWYIWYSVKDILSECAKNAQISELSLHLAEFLIIEDKEQIIVDGLWKIKLLRFIVIVVFVIVISYYARSYFAIILTLLCNTTSKLFHFVIALGPLCNTSFFI